MWRLLYIRKEHMYTILNKTKVSNLVKSDHACMVMLFNSRALGLDWVCLGRKYHFNKLRNTCVMCLDRPRTIFFLCSLFTVRLFSKTRGCPIVNILLRLLWPRWSAVIGSIVCGEAFFIISSSVSRRVICLWPCKQYKEQFYQCPALWRL